MDVAIIGASVSGGTLASCLGNHGVSVALIDKELFPRRKTCGEGLSNVAMDSLRRQGFDVDSLARLGLPYFSYRTEIEGRAVTLGKGNMQSLKGVGIQRSVLDKVILDRASQSPSVATFTGVAVLEVSMVGGIHTLTLSGGERVRARHLVIADGVHSPSAGKLGIQKKRFGESLWGINFVAEGRFRRIPSQVLVILKDGYEVNCTPVSATRLNVTILSNKANVKRLQSPSLQDELLKKAAERNDFTTHSVLPPLQVGPVNSTRRTFAFGDSVWLIGDAAETLDPVAGMGMTFGILLAEAASRSLVAMCRDGVSPRVATEKYRQEAKRLSRPLRGFTRLTASLFRNPLRRSLLPLLACTPLPGLIRDGLDEIPSGFHPALILSRKFLCLAGI